MSGTFFMNQMEENVRYNLTYPYHIDHSKLIGRKFYSETEDCFHQHYFEDVLKDAYTEPNAFYLTDEDRMSYSAQEIEFIEKIIECEKGKVAKGYELMTLELEEETIEYINEYKTKHNCTTEEAINLILKEMVEYFKTNKDGV